MLIVEEGSAEGEPGVIRVGHSSFTDRWRETCSEDISRTAVDSGHLGQGG